jgi:mono/diheme cytochrome c family protein
LQEIPTFSLYRIMRALRQIFAAIGAALALLPLVAVAEPTDAERLFTIKVQPVLSEKCFGCHGDDQEKVKGDYDMLTREKLLAGGGYFGSDVVVLGDAKSRL